MLCSLNKQECIITSYFHFNPGYLGCFVELVMLLPCFLQKANKVLLKQNDVITYFLI